jgi:hypothetical protein
MYTGEDYRSLILISSRGFSNPYMCLCKSQIWLPKWLTPERLRWSLQSGAISCNILSSSLCWPFQCTAWRLHSELCSGCSSRSDKFQCRRLSDWFLGITKYTLNRTRNALYLYRPVTRSLIQSQIPSQSTSGGPRNTCL